MTNSEWGDGFMAKAGLFIFSDINRPPKETISGFAGIPVANIACNVRDISCMNATIRPIGNMPLLGPAVTVKLHPGDNLLLHKALDLVQPGDILVVDAQGELNHPVMGKLMAMWAERRGVGGIVIDGAVHDIDVLRSLNMPIYAAGVALARPAKDGPGGINLSVTCGGAVVHPGDILVGDQDGIVVVNPQDAKDLLIKSRAKTDMDNKIMEDIANTAWERSWIDKALDERCAVIINDSRTFPRANVDAPVTIITGEPDQSIDALAVNISLEGIALQLEKTLTLNSKVRLCLSKELGGFDIAARLIWQQNNHFGFQFMDLSEEGRANLEQMIYRHLQFARVEDLDTRY